MSKVAVAIIGAGPYGLSVAAHLADRNIEHRIFGHPMQFWSQIASAGDARYLKSFCFGTNVSTPSPGFAFADYSRPRGLETFEPCSIADFARYGLWFQADIVPWVERSDVAHVERENDGFAITLENGERCLAMNLVVATGLAYSAYIPSALTKLTPGLAIHTSAIESFSSFNGRSVAVIGAGQSALEAVALLHEAGARPLLLVRNDAISWHTRASREPNLWSRLRSPISGLGSGPKAWALTRYPGAMHRVPTALRTRFVKSHLPAEGAWWLRPRVEGVVPIEFATTVSAAREISNGVELTLRRAQEASLRKITVDHVVAGSGYDVNVDRLTFLDPKLRSAIRRLEGAPNLNSSFESSVQGLRFVGPSSAMSFGPLFRFVVGADYSARIVSADLASRLKLAA